MDTGEPVKRDAVKPEQHFTQPPPRYTEASLVKKLEELGIGRPSTYASIIQVLQDRDYVVLEKKRFIPEDRGRIVTAFLTNFFKRYVEYDFTAELEDQLDDISDGKIDWKAVLRQFWTDFAQAVDGTKDLTIRQVIDALDEALGPHFFPVAGDGKDARLCPACASGRLGLKLGKFGAFIGCSNYPECSYTRRLGVNGQDDAGGGGRGRRQWRRQEARRGSRDRRAGGAQGAPTAPMCSSARMPPSRSARRRRPSGRGCGHGPKKKTRSRSACRCPRASTRPRSTSTSR